MAKLAVLMAALLVAAMQCAADSAASLGYSDETTIVGPGADACASGVLIHSHDESFENAYAWAYGGVVAPYYGAFGEGYDLGSGTISCAAYWVTQVLADWFYGDCYVWAGGVGPAPGAVLAVVAHVNFAPVPHWPEIGQKDFDVNLAVTGPFTIGYWGDWPGSYAAFFCAADLDGPAGHPWTCIAPGLGYPSGWQDPSTIWGPTRSLGCGVYFEQATSARSETWGALKALFRE